MMVMILFSFFLHKINFFGSGMKQNHECYYDLLVTYGYNSVFHLPEVEHLLLELGEDRHGVVPGSARRALRLQGYNKIV